ncbi:alkaline phosphatase D family protein [Bryobacter aggregatus]|uniref:alkaline phosphatase D family protein n=1 Tax=Bryobacter aggregatus TaxID=360054 RepID=UPI0004E158AF|nr:alkaline phosphatase D family protein [Bryobacter aggregatus]
MASMIRRQFLASLAAASLNPLRSAPRFKKDPFTLGICSGDPIADGIVLWTRLALDPLDGGGMGQDSHQVDWIVAEDEGLKKIVKRGTETATPQFAHTVHADVRGLKPGHWYWYQFRCGGVETKVGRTRTAPAAGSNDPLRFAFASCQHYETGYYTAYQHMAKEDLDLIVHLGDYIYEGGPGKDRPRLHNSAEIKSLNDYRNRYALYRSDEHLRKAHELFPWIVTWDDHEVDNNYANDIAEDNAPRDQFLERRSNAYQAYYENMPLRKTSLPRGSSLDLYRTLDFGKTARFHVLDTRQYRSDQPCGDGRKPQCAAALSPAQTMLGDRQEKWLMDKLKSSRQTWNVLANQVMFAKMDVKQGDGAEYSMDQWSGYEVPRQRLCKFFDEAKPNNPVVITGDIHSSWVSEIKSDFNRPESRNVGVEFVGTSITSSGDGVEVPAAEAAFKKDNPHLKFFLAKRGYVSCAVTAKSWESAYRVVPVVSTPNGAIETRAKFRVEAGTNRIERV